MIFGQEIDGVLASIRRDNERVVSIDKGRDKVALQQDLRLDLLQGGAAFHGGVLDDLGDADFTLAILDGAQIGLGGDWCCSCCH